jgi:two-component system, OmpR family, sensor histidine kinase KdpD
VSGLAVSAALVALVTLAIFAVRGFVPVISLGVLYLFAVLPVAVLLGLPYAVAVSVASMLAFNFFFLPPVHTLALRDSANWFALAVYLATAVVVSELAARSRRRTADAEQREREAAFLADVAALLLEAEHVQDRVKDVASRAGEVLGVEMPRIELDSLRRPEPGDAALELAFGTRRVGRLFYRASKAPDPDTVTRVVAPLASIVAVALDRERLSVAALEAETLRRSDAVKTAVLRAVSHDLRSPLTAIRAAGEGLGRRDLRLDEVDRAGLIETITGEAARLERLVTNLIDLSRLEAGAARPRPELWTVDGLVSRALETLGADADRIDVRLSPEPAATRVDGAQIERTLVNLLENALKFSVEEIVVTVELDGEDVLVRVRDHGPGIDPTEHERLFAPFEHGSDGSVGTGLGLAIAGGFAAANGGRIWAEPADGGGSLFTLALPAAHMPAEVRG